MCVGGGGGGGGGRDILLYTMTINQSENSIIIIMYMGHTCTCIKFTAYMYKICTCMYDTFLLCW